MYPVKYKLQLELTRRDKDLQQTIFNFSQEVDFLDRN